MKEIERLGDRECGRCPTRGVGRVTVHIELVEPRIGDHDVPSAGSRPNAPGSTAAGVHFVSERGINPEHWPIRSIVINQVVIGTDVIRPDDRRDNPVPGC